MLFKLINVIYFPLYILIFSSIIFESIEKKRHDHILIRFLMYAGLHLPMLLLPFSAGALVVFIASVFSFLITYKVNIYQSFWMSTLFLFMSTGLGILVQLISPIYATAMSHLPHEIPFIFTNSFFIGILYFACKLTKNRIGRFFDKSQIVSNVQITYPLVIISAMILFCVFMSLSLMEVVYFRVNEFQSMIFLGLLIAFTVVIVIIIDKSFKEKNELEKLRMTMIRYDRSSTAISKGDYFEKSIEFDLMNSEFGEDFISSYTLDALLFSSHNSSIYVLQNKSTGKHYTMKVIAKREGIDYKFEGLKQIDHQSIVPIHEIAEGIKYHYIVKPFSDGMDLSRYVDIHGPLGQPVFKKIVHQMVNILEYLHKRHDPIIYRDLKPSNIIYNPETETISLIDIESARIFDSGKISDTFIVSSRGYAPPEQYGYSQTKTQSDIYALGATMFYLVTGMEPDVHKLGETLENVDIPESLKATIKNCMRFNPEERFKTVGEVVSGW